MPAVHPPGKAAYHVIYLAGLVGVDVERTAIGHRGAPGLEHIAGGIGVGPQQYFRLRGGADEYEQIRLVDDFIQRRVEHVMYRARFHVGTEGSKPEVDRRSLHGAQIDAQPSAVRVMQRITPSPAGRGTSCRRSPPRPR